MHERILIAGSGGQGVISLGKVLASVAVDTVPHVTFFPAYGAEVRGGTSNCQVVLSDREISSPVSEQFDSILILNQVSLDRFLPARAPGGLVIANSSMCDTSAAPGIVAIPASEAAIALGNSRSTNFIMLGAYLTVHPVVPTDDVGEAISHAFAAKGADVIDLNRHAFARGIELAEAWSHPG